MHLHNRQIKATFWNDPDLLQWSREERWFYEGLTQLADDSGCLEDSPFAFKLNLFPSPIDSDITIERITAWVDALVERKKLVRYTSESGKSCLYLRNFHVHQSLKNSEKPDVPLPVWIKFETFESNSRAGKYKVLGDVLTDFLHFSYNVLLIEVEEKEKLSIKDIDRSSNDSLSLIPIESENDLDHHSNTHVSKSSYTPEFESFWKSYPKKVGKPGAFANWCKRLKEKYKSDDLIQASLNYAKYCRLEHKEKRYFLHPKTFLNKELPFLDYVNGMPEITYKPIQPKSASALEEWSRRKGLIDDDRSRNEEITLNPDGSISTILNLD